MEDRLAGLEALLEERLAEDEARLPRGRRRSSLFAHVKRVADIARTLALETEGASAEDAYLAGLLKDHALKIETVSGPGEPRLEVDPAMLAREASNPADALGERLAIVEASLDRLEHLWQTDIEHQRARSTSIVNAANEQGRFPHLATATDGRDGRSLF